MATQLQKDLLANNEKYAASFNQGHLASPPTKKFLVVMCMDARIDPAAALGISLGDAHIIRNAGSNAKDALRSILISQHMLGTREVVLIKHTECGMLTFTNDQARGVVEKNGCKVEPEFDFQPFGDLETACKEDVMWLKNHEALPKGVQYSGFLYDVKNAKLRQVI